MYIFCWYFVFKFIYFKILVAIYSKEKKSSFMVRRQLRLIFTLKAFRVRRSSGGLGADVDIIFHLRWIKITQRA